MELLLGCGHDRRKRMGVQGSTEWKNLVTLDFNEAVKPDVLWDMNEVNLPFPDNRFDEIHAYETLEHTGRQGDWKFFFGQFADFWRILKPGGLMFATVPSYQSVWAWGDPSHARVIPLASLTFLSQAEYVKQEGKTPMTDFRHFYKADFEILEAYDDGETARFALRALK